MLNIHLTTQKHLDKGAGIDNKYCADCDYRSKTPQLLTQHLSTPKHKDKVAGVTRVISDANLALRDKAAANIVAKTYYCDICDKAFGTKADLEERRATRLAGRNHHCSFCEKSFGDNAGI